MLSRLTRASLVVALTTMFFLAPSAFPAETVYVKLANTPLLTSPSYDAKEIKKLAEGTRLTNLGDFGRYNKVKTGKGKMGFILKLRLTNKKPTSAGSLSGGVDDLFGSLGSLGRSAKVNESSTGHSIRGLRDDGSVNKGASKEKAKASVDEMEKISIAPKKLDKFMKEGNVGRYAP